MISPWLSEILTLANTLTVIQICRQAFSIALIRITLNQFHVILIPEALLIPETSLLPETHFIYSDPRNTSLLPGTLLLIVLSLFWYHSTFFLSISKSDPKRGGSKIRTFIFYSSCNDANHYATRASWNNYKKSLYCLCMTCAGEGPQGEQSCWECSNCMYVRLRERERECVCMCVSVCVWIKDCQP